MSEARDPPRERLDASLDVIRSSKRRVERARTVRPCPMRSHVVSTRQAFAAPQ
jgi:hypothetical protein